MQMNQTSEQQINRLIANNQFGEAASILRDALSNENNSIAILKQPVPTPPKEGKNKFLTEPARIDLLNRALKTKREILKKQIFCGIAQNRYAARCKNEL